MDHRTVADVLSRLAFAHEILDGPTHESKAWTNAARVVRQLPGDLGAMLESGALAEVRGIGASSMQVIRDALEGREPEGLRELEAKIPEGLFAIHHIKGLGPAKIRKLWQGLGVTTIGELEHACRENRLVLLDGFGNKTQANVLEAIERMQRADRVLLRSRASALLLPLVGSLRVRGVRAEVLGDFRRGKELVDGLAIAVAGEASAIDETLVAHGAGSAAGASEQGAEGRIDGTTLEVRRTEHARLGVVCVIGTASEEHVGALRGRAGERGLALRDDGLFDGSGALVPCEDEDALYAALGLATTPPERREPGVPLVAIGKAQPRLVELRDLRGALHNHTTQSDGAGTLEEMRAAAAAMQLEYLGISDHSQSADYARGLKPDTLRAQIAAIARTRADRSSPCMLLTGVESDILPDGRLDYDDDVLAEIEVVIASVHKRHGLDREATTRRMITAAKNPFTAVLGHPTGRLLLGRPPNDFDMAAMLDAAAESGCAAELNASPHRLDLDDRHCAMAKERGVLVSIAADAHAPGELAQLEHGIAIARRGGLTAEDVLNCKTLSELRAWLAARRARAVGAS
ncbi:MAG: PHP domain-containing protein [Myxococcota bacterium]|nr:PHP domain-containing protein [Myxococcota bacterium]